MRSFDALIAPYPLKIQALALATRKFVRNLLPGAGEEVDSSGPYITYGYGPGYRGVVCYMTISKVGVKLGIANGATLADPRRLLEGSGKRHRHVPLAASADLRRPGLRQLVRSALNAHQGNKAMESGGTPTSLRQGYALRRQGLGKRSSKRYSQRMATRGSTRAARRAGR